MPGVREDSGFKYVFWGIFLFAFFAIAGQIMWLVLGGARPIPHLLGLGHHGTSVVVAPGVHWARWAPLTILPVVCFLIWVGVVAPIVYRDARRHGMDPYLWAAVAVFVPFFLGIIIYLVVRSNGRTICARCGESIQSHYKVCPYCGHRREDFCPECNQAVEPEWKVCPHCEHRLIPSGG